MYRCRQANLKLNKKKCLFRHTYILFFGKVISKNGVSPDLAKVKVLTDMSPPYTKRKLQSFLGIVKIPE